MNEHSTDNNAMEFQENHSKLIRWNDGVIESFHGTEEEVISYALERQKKRKVDFIII